MLSHGTDPRSFTRWNGLWATYLENGLELCDQTSQEHEPRQGASPRTAQTGCKRVMVHSTANRGDGPDRRQHRTQGRSVLDRTGPGEIGLDRIPGYRGVPDWRARPRAAPNGDGDGSTAYS